MAAFSDAGYANRGSTGYRADTGRNNRPQGPDQVAHYGGFMPNGSMPNMGVTGGLYGLGKAIATGNAYGQYGEPDMAPHDISTRDTTPGSLRGNTGGRDIGMAMAGGAGQVDPMRQQFLQMLIGKHPGLAGILQQQGLLPPGMMAAPQGLQAVPPAPGSAQSPGLKFKPQMSDPRYLGADAPGLKPYGYTTQPYRYFG